MWSDLRPEKPSREIDYDTIMAPSTAKPPLRVLMLHGFTQSGTLFRAKTGALAKAITKAFPSHTVSFSYPTGPLRLRPADVPGYSSSSVVDDSEAGAGPGDDDNYEIESYGWWRRPSTDPPTYKGIEDGLASVAAVLKEEGPFDGVIGFSQGASLAFAVASLLETNRRESFDEYLSQSAAAATAAIAGAGVGAGAEPVPFPESFSAVNTGEHPPLRFAIVYSGFRLADPRWQALYDTKRPIMTPVLHVLGTLDALVTETMSRGLVEACVGDLEKEGKVVFHPGGHFVPSQKPYLEVAVGFIKRAFEGDDKSATEEEEEEERVEDMDVPF